MATSLELLEQQARSFAIKHHEGQTDDDGFPYAIHPMQVADILKRVTTDANVIAAAWLHDTIENCGVTYDELADRFGMAVANLVNEVTHEGTDDNYGYYFPRLHSRDAILIKFADRLSNLSRMGSWDIARQEHYIKQSHFWKDGHDRRSLDSHAR